MKSSPTFIVGPIFFCHLTEFDIMLVTKPSDLFKPSLSVDWGEYTDKAMQCAMDATCDIIFDYTKYGDDMAIKSRRVEYFYFIDIYITGENESDAHFERLDVERKIHQELSRQLWSKLESRNCSADHTDNDKIPDGVPQQIYALVPKPRPQDDYNQKLRVL